MKHYADPPVMNKEHREYFKNNIKGQAIISIDRLRRVATILVYIGFGVLMFIIYWYVIFAAKESIDAMQLAAIHITNSIS